MVPGAALLARVRSAGCTFTVGSIPFVISNSSAASQGPIRITSDDLDLEIDYVFAISTVP